MTRILILFLTAIAAIAAIPAMLRAQGPGDPSLAGTWTGAWGRAADTLAVTMRFEETDGAWSGSFDADRLRVEGIPFQEIEFDPPNVIVRLVGDATTTVFTGTVEKDSLSGVLLEAGEPGWFALSRTTAPAPLLREEEVRFRNGEVELAGTLILPPRPGPHPAIIFVHGSGSEGRWASRFLARLLARNGVAALIWDKRGVGASTGRWQDARFEDLAADATAAVAHLRDRAEIDPQRVGIHGHSQGGTIAPMVAVRSDADFVIASAAAGLPMADVEVYSIGTSIGVSTLPPEEAALARAYVEALVDVAYRGAPAAEMEAAVERARGYAWFFEPPGPDDSYWWFSRSIDDFDPLAWWRQVEVPILLVYGSADERVPVEPSRAAIVSAIESSGRTRVDVEVFQDAGHTFRIHLPGDVWPRTVEGYPGAILDWLRAGILAEDGL